MKNAITPSYRQQGFSPKPEHEWQKTLFKNKNNASICVQSVSHKLLYSSETCHRTTIYCFSIGYTLLQIAAVLLERGSERDIWSKKTECVCVRGRFIEVYCLIFPSPSAHYLLLIAPNLILQSHSPLWIEHDCPNNDIEGLNSRTTLLLSCSTKLPDKETYFTTRPYAIN